MVNLRASIESLRSEYDMRLLDPVERRYQAERLYNALLEAGLWPAVPRILDVGCGAGLKLAFLGDKVRERVGCDIRRDAYLQMTDHVQGIRFVQASGMKLPFPDECFDLVTCISVVEELPDFRAAMAEMARCVAPGGILSINVTNGIILRPLYRFAEGLGKKIPESWWHYVRASEPIVRENPAEGYGISELSEWHYVHLTSFMIRSQSLILRGLPFSWISRISMRFSPTFVHAWQRPPNAKGGR